MSNFESENLTMEGRETVSHVIEFEGKKIKFSGYTHEYVLRQIRRKNEFYEQKVLDVIREKLQGRSGVIIDGGANLGNHSIYFALFCDSTKVIAYEPYSVTRRVLKRNIRDNYLRDKIQVRPLGLYSKETHLKLAVFNDNNLGATEFIESEEPTEFPSTTLDKECADEDIICIKLDIQNLELEALKAAKKILTEQSPLLVLEAMNEEYFEELYDYLKQFGYKVIPSKRSRGRIYYGSSPTYMFEK